MPELNGFYQCKGTISERDDGRIAFAVESIKKLERGCKELVENIPQQDYQTAHKLICGSSDVSSLFSSSFFGKSLINLSGNPSNSESVKDENGCDLNQTAETITEETDLNKTLKEEDYSDTKENVENNENVPAIVISLDKCKNIANLFVLGQKGPLIKIAIKSLEAPVQLGQWYSIKLCELKKTKDSSICYNNFAKLLGKQPPLKTKISSSGTVQVFDLKITKEI
ncbi:unnamed protein product [Meloidogyne enterolobii]|uniref:Uncharacterized protein n=1 Tax=Meloidogyne enterolobii TaxID=390850 RepID=A0ACB1AH41_MELEN